MEVLGDGERREDVVHLRHEVHAASREPVGALARDVATVETHRAAAWAHEPVDGLQQRRLPRAVRPDDRDDLLHVGDEVDAAQDQGVVIARFELRYLQERCGQCAFPR